MNYIISVLRRKTTLIVGVALVALLYVFMSQPRLSGKERQHLASQFHFTPLPLPELAGYPMKTVRDVHPSLNRISAWISSVGAAVALSDLDGDGLPNDLCQVDPRNDQVLVAPVPGTGDRYAPFALTYAPLHYDPATMAPMGCLSGDLNEDGLADLLVYFWGRPPIALLQRAAMPGLSGQSYLPVDVAPSGERWFSNAGIMADVDGDGHVDLVIGNYFQDGGHILDPKGTGVEEMHNTKSKSFNGGQKHLLLWSGATGGEQPNVKFTEVKGVFDEAVNHGWALGAAAADLDGDLLPELYFGHDFGPDRLLCNRSKPGQVEFAVLEGKRDWLTPKSFVLGQDSFKGMGAEFGDINGDGVMDIYVSNITSEWALQESHLVWLSDGDPKLMQQGIAPYVQASEKLGLSRSGWGWDTKLEDMNNDGVKEALQATGFIKGKTGRWPELQSLGTGNDQMMSDPRHWPRFKPGDDVSGHEPNAFFVQADNGRFYNIAQDLDMGEPMVTRGIATADVDGDGDMDFVIANQWEPSTFYRNDCPQCGHYLGLHLRLHGDSDQVKTQSGHPGKDSVGRPAIGAQAIVTLPDGRKLVAQVDGGNGHSGKRSADLHFGLGNIATEVDVKLSWRGTDGKIHHQTLRLKPGWHTILLG